MRTSPLLIAALGLNVVLVGALVVSHYTATGSSRIESGSARPASSDAPAPDHPARLVAWATQHGASEEVAYRLALAAVRPTTTVPNEYWKPAPERAAALRDAEHKALHAMRQLLLQGFGPAAKEQPAFADIFQPYRARLPFLSADKQMALQQILFETDAAGTVISRFSSAATDPRASRIRALLSEQEFTEYQRRESAAALQLANSGFDFSEQEFRAVYDAVNAAGQPQSPLVAAMPAIERVLGATRFQEFQRTQDPTYRWLQAGAKQFGVARETVAAAYGVIKDAQNRVAQLRDPGTARARAEVFAARDRELTARLGKKMFEYIAPRLESDRPRSNWAGDPANAFLPAR